MVEVYREGLLAVNTQTCSDSSELIMALYMTAKGHTLYATVGNIGKRGTYQKEIIGHKKVPSSKENQGNVSYLKRALISGPVKRSFYIQKGKGHLLESKRGHIINRREKCAC